MAKMSMHGVTYEGTPQELREIIATFEAVDSKPAEVKPQYKTEKRHAKVGERILITNAGITFGDYKDGDIRTVVNNARFEGVLVNEHSGIIFHHEYEVIVDPDAKPKPAESITHKGADYALVQRKARAGDVVYVTKDAEGTAIIPNDAKYLVDESGKIEGYDVYPKLYNRTEANVLVYEKVAEPLRVGDTVEVIDGSKSRHGDFGTGTIGVVTDIDVDFLEEIRVEADDDYDRFPASALRKVTEDKLRRFKKGDIVRLAHGSGADVEGTIVEINSDGASTYRRLDRDRDWFGSYPHWFELVAPVESRVDTK